MGLRQSSYIPGCIPPLEDQKAATLDMLFKSIEMHERNLVDRLRKAVSLQSVSTDRARRKDLINSMYWLKEKMSAVGIVCDLISTGMEQISDGKRIDLPPVLLGQLGTSPQKRTLLVYAHMDVRSVHQKHQWSSDPFELSEKEGRLYGRGVADSKAAVVSWIYVLEMFQKQKTEIPVNIKFCVEGMAHCGSSGLEWVLGQSQSWLEDIDFVCITDGQWLGNQKPCLTYGSRGVFHFGIEVSTEGHDLDAGSFGGAVYEPMADLCWIIDHLTDVTGKIMVPGIDKLIAPLSDEEHKLFKMVQLEMEDFREVAGVAVLTAASKVQLLMRIWKCPSLSLNGVEGGGNGKDSQTMIPSKATANVSVHLVPNMTPDAVNDQIVEYLNYLWPKRLSPNTIKVYPQHSILPWITNYNQPHFEAANKAIGMVHGVDADLTRQSRPVPAAMLLQRTTRGSVLVLPLNRRDDLPSSNDEQLLLSTYLQGIKTIAAYLFQIASI